MKPSDCWLTAIGRGCPTVAIVTPSGLWEWTRTPFGMRNSGNTFVRAIQTVLRPIRYFTSSYVYDMAVSSHDWSMHLIHQV